MLASDRLQAMSEREIETIPVQIRKTRIYFKQLGMERISRLGRITINRAQWTAMNCERACTTYIEGLYYFK
jgi:hypothetical protein